MKLTQIAGQLIKTHLERKYKIDLRFHDVMYFKTTEKAATQLLEDYGHVVFGTLTREQLQQELEEVVS